MELGAHPRLQRARLAEESVGVAGARGQRLAVGLGGGEPARLLLGRGGGVEEGLPFVEQAGVGAAHRRTEEGEHVVEPFVARVLRHRLQQRLVSVVQVPQQHALAPLHGVVAHIVVE